MTANSTLNEIFEEFWKWRMSSTPEFATMVSSENRNNEKKFKTFDKPKKL